MTMKVIDWESRRFEIAKEIIVRLACDCQKSKESSIDCEAIAQFCVNIADALISCLDGRVESHAISEPQESPEDEFEKLLNTPLQELLGDPIGKRLARNRGWIVVRDLTDPSDFRRTRNIGVVATHALFDEIEKRGFVWLDNGDFKRIGEETRKVIFKKKKLYDSERTYKAADYGQPRP